MQESFLHYLWQFQHFDKKDLKTTDGEAVDIFQTGLLNNDSGPDFSGAKLKIGNIDWAGNVEIHTKSSGWYDHHHDHDPAYENVILHVVWNEDKKVLRSDGTSLPTILLENRVDISLIDNYKNLVENTSSIPCEKLFHSVDKIIHQSMVDKALML